MNLIANLRARLSLLPPRPRKWLRRSGYLLVLCFAALSVLILLTIDREPWIGPNAGNSQQFFVATRNILRKTATVPSQGKDKIRIIDLSEEDLTAVANFLLLRKGLQGVAKASIFDKRLEILASIRLPIRSANYYLNLKLIADDDEPRAFIKQVKAGKLALPKPLVNVLGWWLMRTTHIGHYVRLSEPLIQDVRIGDGRLRVALNWNREIIGEAQELVADLADKERLRFYHIRLAELVEQMQSKRFVSLAALIRPLFALARERSELEGGDAIGENRAVILVLAAFANGKDLGPAIFPDGNEPKLLKRELLLRRRADTAQHFTGSALLSISGHRALADMVGLAKEFNDTHGGSGFSFTDLAADRAGARFGKLAVMSEDSARRVQAILSENADESLYIPEIEYLPENLSAEQFAVEYADTASPAFQQIKQRIEERISACRLYQGSFE